LNVESLLPKVVAWDEADDSLVLLDQTRLPGEVAFIRCEQVTTVWDAIRRLCVRGAPAIGVAAAYGVCVAARGQGSRGGATDSAEIDSAGPRAADHGSTRQACLQAIEYLATSRPTAVNLFWALDRMKRRVEATASDSALFANLLDEARGIHQQDRQLCAAIGRCGADRLERVLEASPRRREPAEPIGILTHCNAGALATGGSGTALAPIYEWFGRGQPVRVFADETRPLLQGARLTAWELRQVGIPVTVITDSMAGALLCSGQVSAVIVGADRIAASGDVANKIGTYPLAVLARHHGIPFFVAAPHSTFDLSLADGSQIPIEERAGEELTQGFMARTLPLDCDVWNPAFDVTPAELITAIITDSGVIESPDTDRVRVWSQSAMPPG
jgi:methylthioribose-1-phosphate isomerase